MTTPITISNDGTKNIRVTSIDPATGGPSNAMPEHIVEPKQTSPVVWIHSGCSVRVDEIQEATK